MTGTIVQEEGPPTNTGGPALPAPHTVGEPNPMPMPAEFSQLDITSTAPRIKQQSKTRANGFWRFMSDSKSKRVLLECERGASGIRDDDE